MLWLCALVETPAPLGGRRKALCDRSGPRIAALSTNQLTIDCGTRSANCIMVAGCLRIESMSGRASVSLIPHQSMLTKTERSAWAIGRVPP